MSNNELIHDIFSKGDLHSPAVSYWINSSTQFAYFVEKYLTKIQGKVRDAQKDPQPIEKLKDVVFELEIGYLLCKTPHFSVEYEKYGKKGPDFTVKDDSNIPFNVEVKRIRSNESYQVRFDLWESCVKQQIYRIPSRLALYMQLGDDLDFSLELVDRFEERTLEIVKFIADVIPIAESYILTEGKPDFSITVPNFDNEFLLRFRQPPYSTETLADDGCEAPIFTTGQEYRKFDDLYWNALAQGIPGMINVLAINTDSKTHDAWALTICMQYLHDLSKENDIEKTKQLSGVLFRGAWLTANSDSNVLWCNEKAHYPIPGMIGHALRQM